MNQTTQNLLQEIAQTGHAVVIISKAREAQAAHALIKAIGDPEPVLTVKTYKSNTYAHEVSIDGASKVVYSPTKPLSCGARVWVETESPVTIIK